MTTTTRTTGELHWVEPQTFTFGSDDHYREEGPARPVAVDGLWVERYPVTNAEFARFVRETRYTTVAERPLDPADFPDAPVENLQPGSLVFTRTDGPVDLRHLDQWWTWTPGASWRRPEGRGSSLADRADHPVVHVAYADAEAYAAWAGRALPTEAEWEAAARGGLPGAAYTWGDTPEGDGRRWANYWHGSFPWSAEPGYGTTSPVGAFPANPYGLFDMAGNVWEWTTDWYAERHPDPDDGACCVPRNPRGPGVEASYDPRQPQFAVPRKVVKGGSFLCADVYCRRYRPAARRPQMIDTGMSHLGFRCIARPTQPPSTASS